MAERDPLVEHKAFAAPAAFACRRVFQIFQDTALEMENLGKTARQQISAGLLAANAAGAEHRDPAMLFRSQFACRKILELAKTLDAGIDRALEGAHRDFEGVAGVEHERPGI